MELKDFMVESLEFGFRRSSSSAPWGSERSWRTGAGGLAACQSAVNVLTVLSRFARWGFAGRLLGCQASRCYLRHLRLTSSVFGICGFSDLMLGKFLAFGFALAPQVLVKGGRDDDSMTSLCICPKP